MLLVLQKTGSNEGRAVQWQSVREIILRKPGSLHDVAAQTLTDWAPGYLAFGKDKGESANSLALEKKAKKKQQSYYFQ